MYKEVLKYPEGSAAKNILYVLGLVVFVMLFMGLSNFIRRTYQIPFMDYLVFVFMLVFCVNLVNKRIVEYRYSLIDDELIFDKIIGRHQKTLLNVHVSNILAFDQVKNYKKENSRDKIDKVFKFTLGVRSSQMYYILCRDGEKLCKVVFQPSERLIKIIKRSMQDEYRS